MFSRAWHRLHFFPRLASVACFPALGSGCMFSRAWQRLHIFPRLAPVACFPALGIGCMFSRAWQRLHVFPRLAPVACFPALSTGYTFSRALTPVAGWRVFASLCSLKSSSRYLRKCHPLAIRHFFIRCKLTFFSGVIARHPSYVPFIRAALTEESVEKYFKHLFPSPPEEGHCRVKR